MSEVKILIVDDHPENLLALEAILGASGRELVRANSGHEALKALLAHQFALVLMDVAMPGLDGYETAALMRQNERFRLTPIIFMTANNQADSQVYRGYSVGAVDYLFKPVAPEVLLSKVNIFVELYNSRELLKEQAAALKQAYSEMEQRVLERTAELASANAALQADVAERENINRMKDQFLSTLSHELRTPLNAILGWTHLLAASKGDPALVTRATRVIKQNAEAQAHLVTQVLDVSRIIGGKLHLSLEPIDLRTVIESTLDTLHPAATAKRISITTAWDGDTRLVGDRDRLRQVMWNLLSNAIKFTQKGGQVRVAVNATPLELQVVVADNGPGIDAAFLPRVFERFTQSDSTIGRAHGGLGLGMAIVRHLTELHGGRVGVESAGAGLGTTFTVVLPIANSTADTELALTAAPLPADDSASVATSSLEGVSVLIVDDDLDAREILTLALRDQGARVRAVASAAAALRSLRKQVPDVVVSDIGMPGQDGYAFLRKLRLLDSSQGGQVPAVALTAFAAPADAARALAAGFNRHVSKPVMPSEIVEVVASLAARPR
jgi:signal transduction histidine kinase